MSKLPANLLLASALLWAGCASRPLPKYEKPLARASVQSVRTTAYTHTESDHRQYGALSAAGTPLQYGSVRSAAADWARWPKGTLFRISETGEIREVDDYGWALAGTNTIDLYQPTREAMNAWGTRRVHIEILRWGDVWDSHSMLHGRSKFAHVQRMLHEIEQQYSRGNPPETPVAAEVALAPPNPAMVASPMGSAGAAMGARAATAISPNPFYH